MEKNSTLFFIQTHLIIKKYIFLKKSLLNICNLLLFIYNFVLCISIFLLDVINLIQIIMKKAIMIFVLAAMVIVSSVYWFISSGSNTNPTDTFHFGIIAIVLLFAIYVGYKRLSSAKRGEPAEDELSKKVLQKTAAWSFYISLYMWVAMIYIKDRVTMDTEEILGSGILAMAVCFVVCWLVFNFKGIKNE